MISRKLIRTDLNLLVVLQILLEERNVTRAAERLSVSQPALSKTLQKLRDAFEDELFTRTSHGLVPTPRAEELGRDLPSLLENVEQILGDMDFSPDTYVGSFKLLMPPILCESLLPGLMAELSVVAPNVQIMMAEVPANFQELLKKGDADFAAFVALETERDIHAEPIAAIAPRCYMRVGHPLEKKEMDLHDFPRLPPLAALSSWPDPGEHQYGGRCAWSVWRPSRSIVLETTQFSSAVGVLTRTDSSTGGQCGFSRERSLP